MLSPTRVPSKQFNWWTVRKSNRCHFEIKRHRPGIRNPLRNNNLKIRGSATFRALLQAAAYSRSGARAGLLCAPVESSYAVDETWESSMLNLEKKPYAWDCLVALIVCVVCAAGGMLYVATWRGTAHFFQELFGPSVMLACGHGFENPDLAQLPELEAFLFPEMHVTHPPEINAFDCGCLSEAPPTRPWTSFQKRQRYLLLAAGLCWRVLGVAWSTLLPLYGLLIGLSAGALYALFRLGMGRISSAFFTLMLAFSPLHLNNLLRLRDYSKVPFLLAAIFLIGVLIARRGSPRLTLGIAALCGVVVGIGCGFRMDVLIAAPAFCITVVVFVEGWKRRDVCIKGASVLLFLGTLYITSYPVLHALETGMKYQDFLLGFNSLYDQRLGVGDAPYHIGHRYLDREPMAALQAHALHRHGEIRHYEFDTVEYEAIGRQYVFRLIHIFPGDLLLRCYAAVLKTINELVPSVHNPAPRGISHPVLLFFYQCHARFFSLWLRYGVVAAGLSLLLFSFFGWRYAIGGLFFLLYFGGYGAIQFASRHTFHMQFLSMWAMGFLFWIAWNIAHLARTREGRARLFGFLSWRAAGRTALFAVLTATLLTVSLAVFRSYQESQVSKLFSLAEAASREEVTWNVSPTDDGQYRVVPAGSLSENPPPADDGVPSFAVEYWVLDFAPYPWQNTPMVRYEGSIPDLELSWTSPLPPVVSEGMRLYVPVYFVAWKEGGHSWFRGFDLSEEQLGHLQSICRIRAPEQLPLMISLSIPLADKPYRLYQQFSW